jgi:transcriptional regulator with XRE-family HTH domain
MPKPEPDSPITSASPATSRQAVGEEIRRHRESQSLTQGDLAQRIGVSTSKISRIESGESPLDYEVFVTIAKALGVSPPILAFNAHMRDLPDDDVRKQLSTLLGNLLKDF